MVVHYSIRSAVRENHTCGASAEKHVSASTIAALRVVQELRLKPASPGLCIQLMSAPGCYMQASKLESKSSNSRKWSTYSKLVKEDGMPGTALREIALLKAGRAWRPGTPRTQCGVLSSLKAETVFLWVSLFQPRIFTSRESCVWSMWNPKISWPDRSCLCYMGCTHCIPTCPKIDCRLPAACGFPPGWSDSLRIAT